MIRLVVTHGCRLCLLVAVFSFSLAAAAQADQPSPQWLVPEQLTVHPGQNSQLNSRSHDLDVGRSGVAAAVWTESVAGNRLLYASVRLPGRPWETEQLTVGGNAYAPQVAVSDNDDAGDGVAVVWRHVENGREAIKARWKPRYSSWDGVEELSIPANGVKYFNPKIAAARSGGLVVVWERDEDNGGVVNIQSLTRDSSLTWAPRPVDLTPRLQGEAAVTPALSVDLEGNPIAIWLHAASNGRPVTRVQSATGPPVRLWGRAVNWSEPRYLSRDGDFASDPIVERAESGTAVAAWSMFDRVRGKWVTQSRTRPAQNDWSADIVDMSSGEVDSFNPQVAFNQTGNAVVAWRDRILPENTITYRFRPANGDWLRPVQLSKIGYDEPNVDLYLPAVAVQEDGAPLVLWQHRGAQVNDGIYHSIDSDTYGHSFGCVFERCDVAPARLPKVKLDSQGNAVAIWERFAGDAGWTIETATRDVAPPKISSLVVPEQAVVGESVEMYVKVASDASGVGDIWWNFGDHNDSQGRVNTVEHVYNQPGEYRVGVTVFDGFGFYSKAETRIRVVEAPGEPGQPADPRTPVNPTQPVGPPLEPSRPPVKPKAFSQKNSLKLRVGLSRSRYKRLRISLSQNRSYSERLKFLTVRLGRGANAIRISNKGLGSLTLKEAGGRALKAKIVGNGSRLSVKPVTGKQRLSKQKLRQLRKIRLKPARGRLTLSRLPSGKFTKIVVTLGGKRSNMVTVLRSRGAILFDAVAKPSTGGDLKAEYRLKL